MVSAACTADVHAVLPGIGQDTGEDTGFEDGDTSTDSFGEDIDGGTDLSGWLDLGGGDEPQLWCQLIDPLDGALPCEIPLSTEFAPVVGWTWTGPAGEDSIVTTPLVANLDDDNLDGLIDLCDQPEVLVAAFDSGPKGQPQPAGHLYIIDSVTGETELGFEHPIDASVTPAIADLDGDGSPEILAMETIQAGRFPNSFSRRVVAFEADGTIRWVGSDTVTSTGGGAIAVADLDGDGSPEIIAPDHVLYADGIFAWAPSPSPMGESTPIPVDLDLDGQLEILFGGHAYDQYGVQLFKLVNGNPKNFGSAAIANFDDDPYPEIYVQGSQHRILEHDGSSKGGCPGGAGHPVAIEDLDGDGRAEILHGHQDSFRILEVEDGQCVASWLVKVDELEAASSGTAFDFMGDGSPEAVYADRSKILFIDASGNVLEQLDRSSGTSSASPVVADIDNDGAAEVLVTSTAPHEDPGSGGRASLMMIQNADDGFAATRRIWNQHTYHATNVAEDATIPLVQAPHSTESNGFRTNRARLVPADICQPPATL